MTEKHISEVVEAAQKHFVVFYTKERKIELQDVYGNVEHTFDTWEEVNAFIELLDESPDASPAPTDMTHEEYDAELEEEFKGITNK